MSVKKRPDGKWRARYYDSAGKEHSRHFARKVDAESWERDQRAAVARGTHVDPAAGRETVRVYGERWRAAQVQHRPETATKVEVITRLHVYPVLGDRRIASVRRSDIQALVTAWSATAAPNSVASRFGWLAAIFKSATVDGVIGVSPCSMIRLPEVVGELVVPLTVAQVTAIHDAIAEPYRPAILVGAGCGPRISEVLGITKDSVRFLSRDLDVRKQLSARKPWRLVPVKSKNSPRTVPAPTFVTDALSQLTPGAMLGTLLHRGDETGEPISQVMLSTAFAGAVLEVNRLAEERARGRKAGRTTEPELPTVPAGTTFHDLRHTYASMLIDGGESVTVVADRLGDTAAQVLKTYSHLWPDSADRTRRIVDAAWSHQDQADELRTVGSKDTG
ncbi:site-specific integrase [Frankia sp. AgB1.9]|uniref:tyrosine-type recombinase/integrase n=1 Tax=unclassified Frankia TaxID=2632575 RepID=UPI001933C928|nr:MULTISPECIES: site-specific integrase [unclassified Frankia]MBL7493880.1 site-specific integrase [Frankia sp. AgW1.1]MBL7552321.1 site-specific integrase [Frankia sp. AgB1.9]MBL7622074.1 site-specific integrase [Frankia sp. AgB1.8]